MYSYFNRPSACWPLVSSILPRNQMDSASLREDDSMHVPPLLALLAWVPIGLYFFYRYPIRVAVLLTFIAGWAVLPTANFVPTDAPFPYWILGASLPAGYFVTKATITGLTALAGSCFSIHALCGVYG